MIGFLPLYSKYLKVGVARHIGTQGSSMGSGDCCSLPAHPMRSRIQGLLNSLATAVWQQRQRPSNE